MEKKQILLPKPQIDLDYSLMNAIFLRRTIRRFEDKEVSIDHISNILWVCCGITKDSCENSKSKRTTPSACNSQEIIVYVATKNGLFLYDEINHVLVEIFSKDIREFIGTQKMMQSAPLCLIYVSDYSKMTSPILKNDEQKRIFSFTDVGFIGQNVYLYCAISNLATTFLGLVDRENLHDIMNLKECEKVLYTQVIGYIFEE